MAGLLTRIFNFSKLKDESQEEQIADINIEHVRNIALTRSGCDIIPGTAGSFGRSPSNPIPVNCIGGEIKYINSLLCSCGTSLIGHRLGHFKEERFVEVLDVYETVCAEGAHWDIFYFNMYFPRRSKKVPKGYSFRKFHEQFSRTNLGMTTNQYIETFPELMIDFPKQFKVGELLENAIIRKIGYRLKQRLPMIRSDEHLSKLRELITTGQFEGRSPLIPNAMIAISEQ
jgi:hypothetical protein